MVDDEVVADEETRAVVRAKFKFVCSRLSDIDEPCDVDKEVVIKWAEAVVSLFDFGDDDAVVGGLSGNQLGDFTHRDSGEVEPERETRNALFADILLRSRGRSRIAISIRLRYAGGGSRDGKC